MKALRFCSILILLTPALTFAEIHPKVQAALDYQVPENTCGVKPKSFESTGEVVGAPIEDPSSTTIFEGTGADEMSDIDTNTRRRQERKMKRWKKCTAKFKEGLLVDMEDLKASAQHGLTQAQADIILANMAKIQTAYMAPE